VTNRARSFAVGFFRRERYLHDMTIPITAQIQRDGKWIVAFCPEFPEANGQGDTQQAAIESLKAAIELLLEDRREDARRKLPVGAELVEIR
jgi:predicted RNase H-like HicB family nuclease